MARLLRRQKSRKLWVLVTLLLGWCWNRSPGFLGSGTPPGRPSEGQRLATNQQLGQAVKERDDEILEQLRDDEGAYQADLLGSPRPLFTLTEQWGLLGLLVGLVVVLASMGGMESSFLDLLQGGWDQTQAMEALTTLNEGTAAAGAEVAGGILEPGLSIALPGLLASLGSLAGLVVQGIKALTNVVGMTLAAGGYAVGKVSASVRNTLDPDAKQGVADSDIFQMAFGTWLRCNGIVPSVTYDPIPPVPGTEAFKPEDVKQTPIILCNHTCYLDGMVLASVFHGPKIIAMKGTLNVPVIGLFAQDIGVIEVDRADPKSRAATIKAIEDHVANWKPGRQPLLLFPEGTTSNGQGLLEFRKGAFVPGVPIRPAVLCYTGSWDPANTSYRETDGKIQAIEDTEWAEQFLGHMMHSVQIRVLPPYVPSEEEKADPLVFASNVRKVMGEAHAELRKEVELKGRPTTIQAIAQKGVDLVEDVTSGVTSGLTSLVEHTRDGALAVIGTQSPQSSPGGQEEFRRGVSGSLAARAAHNRERRHKTPASSLQASPASSPSSQRTV